VGGLNKERTDPEEKISSNEVPINLEPSKEEAMTLRETNFGEVRCVGIVAS
jgi:hypothetical protein